MLYLYGSIRATAKLLDMLSRKPIVVMLDTGTACVLLSQNCLLILCTACMHEPVMLGHFAGNCRVAL